jgi:microcystin-dependent protein
VPEPFIAEIRIFAGNFAPRGWAFCEGQLLPIAQNTALFSLIGTTFGGDGRTTTALPNLKGRTPMHPGSGPGLTSRNLGQSGGASAVTLSEAQMPPHKHAYGATSERGSQGSLTNGVVLGQSVGGTLFHSETMTNLVQMDPQTLINSGGGGAHANQQPSLGLNFIIALTGVFPSRN